MPDLLANYQQLVKKVDQLCESVAMTLGDRFTCSAGCATCCLNISVFPVEVAAMLEAALQLPSDQYKQLKTVLNRELPEDACPFLSNELCLMYQARPIICRTHGLPLLIAEDGNRRIDFCPHNCKGMERIPGNATINLEQLNNLLVSINLLYLKESASSLTEKIRLSEFAKLLP